MSQMRELIVEAIKTNLNESNGVISRMLLRAHPTVFRRQQPDTLRRWISEVRKEQGLTSNVVHGINATTKIAGFDPRNSCNRHKSPRILLLDIETAPILAQVWRIWDENIGLEQIRGDKHLLSFAAKWLGEKDVIYEDQSKAPHLEDDTQLLKSLWNLLNEADVVIAHNGRAFDVPMIKARMVIQGFAPPSPFRHVDTLMESRKFGFTSNKLEYLAGKLGCPKGKHKEFAGFELWKECLEKNPRAWAEMKKYNIRDVHALEVVYLRLRPWIDGHPNVAIFTASGEVRCPKCGGKVKEESGKWRFTNFGRYKNYFCTFCHGWSRGRMLLNDKKERNLQLAN